MAGTDTTSYWRYMFPSQIWLTRSTLVDLGLLSANALLKIGLFIPLIGGAFQVGFYTVTTLAQVFGPLEVSQNPLSTELILLYTLTLILALDGSRYCLHRAMHHWPLLWRFHKLHHSATRMTPLTLYRIHPVESLLQYLRDILVTGIVTGCFFYFCGRNMDLVTILGVNAARFIFNLLGANLRHSHIWLSFGPLEKLLISPAQHQIHHSIHRKHHNKNFGSQFAIWDLLGGTLVLAKQRKQLKFGLSKEINR